VLNPPLATQVDGLRRTLATGTLATSALEIQTELQTIARSTLVHLRPRARF